MKSTLQLFVPFALLALRTFGAAPDRESTLRFPDSVIKANAPYAAAPDADYHHASEAAYQSFRDIKYGVRIHWGLYSLLPHARESWTFLELSDAERQKYLESYKLWNPQGFDAEQWMQFFDRAGFRCFAITTKHHEGFSLFDTKTHVHQRPNYVTPTGIEIENCDLAYSVMDTPFKRDIVKELCDAAHQHDIKINLYFSHTDWYDADFRPYGRHPLQTVSSDKKALEERQKRPAKIFADPTPEAVARMVARHRAQLKELLTNYGKIDMVCLDISLGASVWPETKETIKELRQIQPDVMFRNRGIGNYGDYYTPERVVPEESSSNPMPWMVIYPLGTNFSWEPDAAKYKGAKWVIDNLVDSVAKGGNFMVGIGPDANGRFHPTAIAQLEEVGAWLKVNGEGIFNSRARKGEGWKDGDTIRLTESRDGSATYAYLTKRPSGSVVLHNVKAAGAAVVRLLGYDQPLTWQATEGGMIVTFPSDVKEAPAYALKITAR
jgi:alpha-L-fucosidase